ncbi:hypothetical protein DC438_12955 [Cronobacter sakazakii]|uniref:Uncharacterized protein n=1 Tax=Cronobacter sakazakii TaxID=28141 RepID=A0A2S9U921_CROSK|nr:hypothetical protein ES15_2333 [Cronobacter sakazakii ES15]AKE96416.1 hypothetical protein CSK29544_03469 [Cronobacter sakazakii]AZP33986.1 hypothetical protein DC438_12955 [Cronobacter sakazakii]EGT4265707.1 hypothetical protein [Cronobacter sakazakii]EGT4282547.1 hypothetical protein [Cronobacter sakazakii]
MRLTGRAIACIAFSLSRKPLLQRGKVRQKSAVWSVITAITASLAKTRGERMKKKWRFRAETHGFLIQKSLHHNIRMF